MEFNNFSFNYTLKSISQSLRNEGFALVDVISESSRSYNIFVVISIIVVDWFRFDFKSSTKNTEKDLWVCVCKFTLAKNYSVHTGWTGCIQNATNPSSTCMSIIPWYSLSFGRVGTHDKKTNEGNAEKKGAPFTTDDNFLHGIDFVICITQ